MSYLRRLLSLLTVVTLVIGGPGGLAQAASPETRSSQPLRAGLPPSRSATIARGQAKRLTNDGAELEITAGAVAAPTVVSITPLAETDLPSMDQGMTNVTAGPRRGYRFLPHPMKFKSKIRISLPYDKRLIPPGLTEQDIKTFYFDDQAGSWKELERVSVDTRTQTVISLSDHFTDMANATVTVPDHPEPASLDPNSMQDIQAADPAEGINVIEAPGASSTGDAALSYPIEVPPGRKGMQPELSLDYSSSAGNGWLGMGWDLPTQSVGIDTRWGVPRYDARKETETYLLDGEQLTPLAHRGEPKDRTPEKVFHTRVEGGFDRIVRHGTSPANYWWQITDRSGTQYLYGGGSQATDGPTTLTDAGGNVFRWALREVRDMHGNGIKYRYERVSDPGIEGGSVEGSQLYLESINYTWSGGADGAYTVTFVRDSELPGYSRRPDVTIDARGGFKIVTAALLERIEVTFEGRLVRSYDLEYTEGAFRKTLLKSVTQRGEDGQVFHTHQFAYYDEVREAGGAYQGFGAAKNWQTRDDGVTAGLMDYGRASALSGAVNDSVGGHLYIGFNPAEPTKQNSFGGKLGFNYGRSDGTLSLIDINGDNLPDKVFKQGNRIRFRLNESGPSGGSEFGERAFDIPTLHDLSQENDFTLSFGLEAYPGIASLFANYAHTFTLGSTYFSDVNGDDLPDLVTGGSVLFNHLDGQGVPTFTSDSSDTGVPVAGGEVDTDGIVQDYEELYQRSLDNFPLQDTLRRWTAPFDGRVQITGDVQLLRDTSEARKQYKTADGVRVAIQHNGSELWSATMEKDDYAPRTPAGVSSITVRKGDRVYFRVQSREDGRYDQVAWDPEIAYLDVPQATDVNGLDQYRYRASEDFVLAGRRGMDVRMPLDGTVRLTGNLTKSGATTDGIAVLVTKNGREVVNKSMGAGDTGEIAVSEEIGVNKGDSLRLRVRVDSPIDLRKLQWRPNLFYTASTDPKQRVADKDGKYLLQLHPPYDIDTYPASDLAAPQESWRAPRSGKLTVLPHVATNLAARETTGTVTVTVKRRGSPGELLGKHTVTITNGSVENGRFEVDAEEGDALYFDLSTDIDEISAKLTNETIEVQYPDPDDSSKTVSATVPSALHRLASRDEAGNGLYPQPYRGWDYAGYNGNRERAVRPVDESLLVFRADDYNKDECRQGDHVKDDPATSQCNPTAAKAYVLAPFPDCPREDVSAPDGSLEQYGACSTPRGEGYWGGSDDLVWVTRDKISSSRLGVDHIDVPRPGNFAGGRAVTRLSHADQLAVGAEAVVSGSYSFGTSYSEVDFLDMNGDQFPDIVGNGRVQYTTPRGGLEARNTQVIDGRPRKGANSAWSVGIGGSPAQFKPNSRGEVGTAGRGARKGNGTGSQMVSLGVSAELGSGKTDLDYDLLDVNGDGLPDRVDHNGSQLKVSLNLGYSFAAQEPWGEAAVYDGASESGAIGGSLGFNSGIYDFAGGLSLGKNKSHANQALLDINGDGLPDRVSPDGESLRVAFNTGNGFSPEVSWGGSLPNGICKDETTLGTSGADWNKVRVCDGETSLGGGVYFTVGVGPLCLAACYLIINPGFDYNRSMSHEEAALRDVDGDGYADHVASTADDSMRVAQNRTGRTNLLKSIQRPLGARIDLEYQRDGNTYDEPESRWVLSRVSTYDGHPGDGADTQVTTYRYEDGRYDRLEREFYGYGKVSEEHRNPADGAVYRSIVREFLNDNYYDKGLLKRELTQDASGRPYVETENTYYLRDVASGTKLADVRSTTATAFPELIREEQRFYEGNAEPGKSTYVTYEYDASGNVVEVFDAADVGAGDDVATTVEYSHCADLYLVDEPTKIVVKDSADKELRHREAAVDCASGDVTQVRQYLQDGQAAITDLEYFGDGNLKEVTGPANKRGQRYELSYEYDDTLHTYPTKVTDSFGYTSTARYDLKYGEEESDTDTNGNTTSYTLDNFGRTTSVTGTYDQGSGKPTVSFEYHPEAAVPWALTRRLDTFRSPTDSIDTAVLMDGLGRVLQTKQDSTVHVGPDSPARDVMIVSGRVKFDFVGRVTEQWYPITEPLGAPGAFNDAYDSVQPTRTAFDVLDRATKITAPDGASSEIAYGFGPDRSGTTQFETTTTDANGNVKQSYQGVGGLTTAVRAFNTPQGGARQAIWTSYDYDPLGQIVETKDDKNNVTRVAYDNLGRETMLDNPDTGKTETVYDLASNPVARITPNLRAEGRQIGYEYDFNRLRGVAYPDFPGNNVAYTYGAPGAPDNRAGRIAQVTDESGKEELSYGKLGEITRETRTVASDTQGASANSPEVYTTTYVYDAFGRLQTLTYPDGEVLTYKYDSGGQVRQAAGEKGGYAYSYVKRLEYDKFGQRAFVEAGNNIQTRYSYRPDNLRLQSLQAGKGGGNLFQNLAYRYDKVGNVLGLVNDVPVPPASQFGGPSTQTFTYDDLYRLTAASGSYRSMPGKERRYRVGMSYDTIHNIVSKQQSDEIVQPSGTTLEQRNTSYNWAYAYGGSRPHAATHIGDRTYGYDANGNQSGWQDDRSGARRRIVWDEEDRIQSLFDNGHEETYKYDDGGQRVMKRGPQGETVYVNQYFTVRNREVGTKHVYTGGTLMASKLAKQAKPGTSTGGQMPLEKDLYFYHPDHLGSSSYVTDADGKLYEHLEYFPSGETWMEESSNTQRTPYLFTSKELDEETGLYYYGARYYDPRTSLWQSPDPALDGYMEGSGNGGVYEPLNLSLYAYAYQNPVAYTDPNGEVSTRVPYFTSPYAKWVRRERSRSKVGGRNLATAKYKVVSTGKKWVLTKTSKGFHSETRIKKRLDRIHPGDYEVLWLYTELEPCGSGVHNCRRKVGKWNWSAKGERVFYSVDYPSVEDVSDDERDAADNLTGGTRDDDDKGVEAQSRRHIGPTLLKRFQTVLQKRRKLGTPLDTATPANTFKPALRQVLPPHRGDRGFDT